MPHSPASMRLLPFFVLSVGLVLWTYAPAFNSYLVADDFQWLSSAMGFSLPGLFDVGGRDHFYRPVVEVYFATLQSAFGCSARALHVASAIVHLVNVALVAILAWESTGVAAFAGISGLLFAVQPAPAEAVLWPSAITTLLSATFGLTMLILDVQRTKDSTRSRSIGVTLAFAAALGCHEGAVTLLPAALMLRYARGPRIPVSAWVREYAPSAVLLVSYVALTAWINSRNYVVSEGHYTVGSHIGLNLVSYLVGLYAGRQRAIEYVFVLAVCLALVIKGSWNVRAWTAWMLVAVVPVLPFAWGTSSRYMYVPSIPFSYLVAHGIMWLLPIRRPIGIGLVTVTTAFVLARSSSFARKGAEAFELEAAKHEAAADMMRRDAAHNRMTVERSAVEWMKPLYVLPLARTAACESNVEIDLR